MPYRSTNLKLAHLFQPVKPDINSQFPLFSGSMTHHSKAKNLYIIGTRDKVWKETRYYGVSSYRRILPKELFLKRYDQVRDCLKFVLGLPTAEREFTLRAVRFGSYYGNCYAKISTLCQEPGCSKSTAFRVLRKLKEQKLIKVIPRIITPFRRQTSSLILFHELFLLIAKYLAEHIAHIWPDWIMPVLNTPWPELWNLLEGDRLKLPLPAGGSHTVRG